jgi:uncharacterized membrane protein
MSTKQKHPPANNKPQNQVRQTGNHQPVNAGVQQNSIQVQQTFTGPLPHPSILEGYDKVLPGAAERIIAMAESDMRHQQKIEQEAIRVTGCQIKRGQTYAFWLAVIAFACCLGALFMGSETVAGIIAGTTIGGLITAFVVGKYKDDD